MRHAIFILISLTFALSSSAQVRIARTGGQGTNTPQQGQVFGGILRTLTDTARDFSNTLPTTPRAGAERQANPQQVAQAQRSIRQFANEAGQLIPALRYEEQYSPMIGRLLGDALRVKATADVLEQRSQSITDVPTLGREYEGLDRLWRLLSHQLTQSVNLNAVVKQRVDRLDSINQDLSQQLKVAPQFQQNELIYFFSVLGEELDNLSEDIRIDLYSNPKREEFLSHVRQLRNRSQQLRLANEYRYPYETVKTYYEEFHADWLNVKSELRGVRNHHVQRCISRITRFNDRIHELLLLPPMIDGNDILYQAETLEQQVDSIGAGIPLVSVLELPNSDEVFGKVKEFHQLCHDFRQTVSTSTELDTVRWDFRVLDVAWNDLKRVVASVASPETVQNVAVLDSAISELRGSLAIGNDYDTQQSFEMVTTLVNMTDLLRYDVTRHVGSSSQFPAQFRNQIMEKSKQFHRATQIFQQNMQRANSPEQLRGQARQLGQKWSELQTEVAKLPLNQNHELIKTTQSISSVIARLQLSFGF